MQECCLRSSHGVRAGRQSEVLQTLGGCQKPITTDAMLHLRQTRLIEQVWGSGSSAVALFVGV